MTEEIALRRLAEFNPTVPVSFRARAQESARLLPMDAIQHFDRPESGEHRPVEDLLQGYSYIEPTDVAYAKVTPCFENGKGIIGSDLEEPAFASSEVTVLRPGPMVDQRYLSYVLRSEAFRGPAISSMTGAGGLKRVDEQDMRAFKVRTPAIDEQRAIADYLDHETAEIDAFLADLQQAEELIDEHWKSSLIKFIQHGLDESAELVDTGVTTWPQAPTTWGYTRLKNTVDHSKNGSWGSEPFEDEVTVRCIRVADFDKESSKIHDLNPTERSYPSAVIQTQGLSAGDLLIEKSGGGPTTPVGNVVKYEGDGGELYSNFTARIVVSAGVSPRYALYLHKSLYLTGLTSRSVKQSTGIQNLDMTRYLNEEIYLPPPESQASIARRIEGERVQIDSLRKDIHRATHLARERRAALISAAVTGQIDVTKRHKPVAEVLEDEVREMV